MRWKRCQRRALLLRNVSLCDLFPPAPALSSPRLPSEPHAGPTSAACSFPAWQLDGNPLSQSLGCLHALALVKGHSRVGACVLCAVWKKAKLLASSWSSSPTQANKRGRWRGVKQLIIWPGIQARHGPEAMVAGGGEA